MKKSLAWICTLVLLVTSTSAVFSFVASATVTSDKYVNDFSNGLTGIYTVVKEDVAASISAVNDASEPTNSVMSIKTTSGASDSYPKFQAIFPFELEVGKSYSFSYRYKNVSGSSFQINKGAAWTTGYTNDSAVNIQAFADTVGDKNYDNIIAYFMKNSGASVLNDAGSFNWNSLKTPTNSDWHEVSFTFTADENLVNGLYKQLAFNIQFYGITGEKEIYIDDISIEKLPDPRPVTKDKYETDFNDGLNSISTKVDGDTAAMRNNAVISSVSEKGNESNKVLSIKTTADASGSYPKFQAIFPFELEVGKSYSFSYRYKNVSGSSFQINKGAAWTTGYTNDSAVNIQAFADTVGDKNYDNIIAYFMKNQGDSVVTGTGGINWNSLKTPTNSDWHEVSFTFTADENLVNGLYKQLAFNIQFYGITGEKEIYIDDISIEKLPDPRPVTKDKYETDFNDGLNSISTKVDGDTAAMRNTAIISAVSEAGNDSNKVLSIKTTTDASGSYPKFQAIFPFEIEVGKSYTFSYKYKNVSGSSFQLNQGAAWTTGYANDSAVNIQPFANTVDDKNYDNIIAYFMKNNGDSVLNDAGNFNWNSLKTPTNSDWHEVSFAFTADENLVNGLYKQLAFNIQFYGVSGEKEIYIDDVNITRLDSLEATEYYTDFSDGSEEDLYVISQGTAEMTTDPADETNNVLSFTHQAGNDKILIPVKVVAGNNYAIRYKYKVDSTVQTTPASALYISKLDGTKLSDLYEYSGTGANENNLFWKITDFESGNVWTSSAAEEKDWVTRLAGFTAETDGFVVINLTMYSDDGVTYTGNKLYIDDISLTPYREVSFETNGSEEKEAIYAAESSTISIVVPSKAGYNFAGWYSDASYANYVGFDSIVVPNKDTVIYAKWNQKFVVGNIDQDVENKVNAADLTQMRRILLDVLTDYDPVLADCNGDDTFDIRDLVALKKYVADVRDSLGKTVDGEAGYQLVWSDEFNGNSLNWNHFSVAQIQGDIEGVQYVDDSEYLYVSDGTLKMVAEKNNEEIKCAKAVRTDNLMNMKYGYVEVSAKLPYLNVGEWPAIWGTSRSAKLASEQNVNYGFEVDMAENIQNGTLQAQLHIWGPDASDDTDDYRNLIVNNTRDDDIQSDLNDDFHTYGMRWNEDAFAFYLDGELYASLSMKDLPSEVKADIFEQFISLRLNNAVSDTFVSGSNKTATVEIDYVRVYQIFGKGDIIAKP